LEPQPEDDGELFNSNSFHSGEEEPMMAPESDSSTVVTETSTEHSVPYNQTDPSLDDYEADLFADETTEQVTTTEKSTTLAPIKTTPKAAPVQTSTVKTCEAGFVLKIRQLRNSNNHCGYQVGFTRVIG
jgi:hypothetical protein